MTAIRYHVTHRTLYLYDEPVTSGHTLAHLVPREAPWQQVQSASVRVDPVALEQSDHLDRWGNRITYVSVEQPHDHLEVLSEAEVTVWPQLWPAETDSWEVVVAATTTDTSEDGLLARACVLPSRHVPVDAAVADYAAPSFPRGRPIAEALGDLSERIHRDFVFDPAATEVSTPLADVLSSRRGVCQDFAHLAIGCLRSVGLGARYVSGYIETVPIPGQPRLVGADASHAWCSVRLPGWGWLDVDPTNDQLPPERHVTVAWGRDYDDVAPVRGVVFGPSTRQTLEVAVDVHRIE
ncbi:MAG TPA: transglutaminase family protein [Acidimicrobiales bacterium]